MIDDNDNDQIWGNRSPTEKQQRINKKMCPNAIAQHGTYLQTWRWRMITAFINAFCQSCACYFQSRLSNENIKYILRTFSVRSPRFPLTHMNRKYAAQFNVARRCRRHNNSLDHCAINSFVEWQMANCSTDETKQIPAATTTTALHKKKG